MATLLNDADEHDVVMIRGEGPRVQLSATQAIRAGQKIALRALAEGDRIVKYGYPIGSASRQIAAGEWVHLHNCRSFYDALSSELDVESGARNETRYV